MSDATRIPLVDDEHCDPKCPFLKPAKGWTTDGVCTRDNVDLSWHDYYLAQCADTAGAERETDDRS